MYTLQIIDELTIADHYHLETSDTCYFFGTYTSGAGYTCSKTNQLILNFKKDIKYKGTNSWPYKEEAINYIRLLLSSTFDQNESIFKDSTIVPMPPSKAKHDPNYDDRLVRTLSDYFDMNNEMGINAMEMILFKKTMEPSHAAYNRPPPQTLIDNMVINPKINREQIKDRIIIFDDVLTTGAHFKTAKHVIENELPDKEIIGLFIARRKPEDPLKGLYP